MIKDCNGLVVEEQNQIENIFFKFLATNGSIGIIGWRVSLPL